MADSRSSKERDQATSAERVLTWATLLAQWTDFARAAVALPDTPAGSRWKAVIADIIGLQAHVHALTELRSIPAEERPLALDRAEIAIRDHTRAIHAAWQAEPMPETLVELVDDARLALRVAAEMGVAWIADADMLEMPTLDDACSAVAAAAKVLAAPVSLWIARPGTPVFAGTPVAQLVSTNADDAGLVAPVSSALEGLASPAASCRHVQVYREVDPATGRPVRDLIVPMDETLPAGQPMLEQRIDAGDPATVRPSAVRDPEHVGRAQRAALGGGTLPVIQPKSPWLVEDQPAGA